MKKHHNKWLAAASIALMVSACSSDMSDLEQFVEDTKQKYQGSVEPIPPFKPYTGHEYTHTGRDPFSKESLIARLQGENQPRPGGDITRPREPLELVPISSLSMTGTLRQGDIIWGIIKDSDDNIHRVKKGNYVGENQGQITQITDAAILVTELALDNNGLWTDKVLEILLKED